MVELFKNALFKAEKKYGGCMKKIDVTKILKQDSSIMVQFEGNHAVAAVKILFLSAGYGKFSIKIAQNGILSDLIPFSCEKELNGEYKLEFAVETPVSASNIFIFSSNEDIEIDEISVFEREENSEVACYPAYIDTDLSENYYLDTISVFTSADGYLHYSVYTSMDGRDFDFLVRKSDNKFCGEDGDVYSANGREARVIRVYIEYNSASTEATLDDVKFMGKKSATSVQECPKIDIPNFEDSEYNIFVSKNDTYEEVYGIIERRLGAEYRDWFDFSLAENPRHTYDYFELKENDGKIQITANNGVSLAAGVNHYLKYYCKVSISQVGDQTKMPEQIVSLKEPVFRETKAVVRYAYNYCTLSYSMAFWGEKEWRDELDWLALNGVNAVLDATAQEEVWRRFLGYLGYTHEEIKKYIAGPAYYAWAYMANLFGFGGPVHDSWFEERTELARKNHLIMRKLGIHPILQGYSGMVPVDIQEHNENAEVIPQGTWCSFTRPYMLRTTSSCFGEYAEKFYRAQKEVYGTCSKYFATDPFHEGGIVADMSTRSISKEILSAMLKANPNAVWVIQSWQQNPTSELLAGLDELENGKKHALVLDLYAEKQPNYDKGCEGSYAYGNAKEFANTPWLFCMLNNFGGRLGLHGHLDNLAKMIPMAFNSCKKIAGIGITPEASVNNPVLYDFLFECIWQKDAAQELPEINLQEWLYEYSVRRYGAKSEYAQKAWDILKETVYKAEFNSLGQGAPESVLNARPSLSVKSASAWGNAVIGYDKKELQTAAKLLLKDYDKLKDSEGYRYDLVTVLQQILSNHAQEYYGEMVYRFHEIDIVGFEKAAARFLSVADDMESVLECSEYYMLGRWVEQAKALAKNADDFSKMLYEFNAKALITTWGAYNQSEIGQLHDYSNRQWAGLIGSFYKPRWERWITNRRAELSGKPFEKNVDWFEWEWNWVWSDTAYPTKPKQTDLAVLGEKILSAHRLNFNETTNWQVYSK